MTAEAAGRVAQGEAANTINSLLSELQLLRRSRLVREGVAWTIKVDVDPVPPFLDRGKRAFIVSNYPKPRRLSIPAVLKALCELPDGINRAMAVAGKDIQEGMGFFHKALGTPDLILPATRDESGQYGLSQTEKRKLSDHMGDPEGRESCIWATTNGETHPDDLSYRHVRAGAVFLALRSRTPIVPMALVSKTEKGKTEIAQVR